MTGYSDRLIGGAKTPSLPLIQKPFTRSALLQRVRDVLDARDVCVS
jgi:hypothetical protein